MIFSNTKQDTRHIIIWSFLFIVVSHGYRFFNLMYSHDALMILQQDYNWQISLGRWLQPLVICFRGAICAPQLLMVNQGIFLTASAWLLINLFKVKSYIVKVIIIGLIISNKVITITNASFLPWSDLFSMSLFFSIFSVYLFEKLKDSVGKHIMIIASIICMLALYQGYLSVLISIILMTLLLTNDSDLKSYVTFIIKWLIYLALAGVIYYVVWKLLICNLNIEVKDTYNGLSNAKIGLKDFFIRLKECYSEFYYYFYYNSQYSTLPLANQILTVLLRIINSVVIIMVAVISIVTGKGISNRIIRGVGCLLFPVALGSVKIFSGDTFYTLVKYSYILIYVMLLIYIDRIEIKSTVTRVLRLFVVVIISFFVWNNIVFANQAYTEKAIQEKQTFAYVVNLINRIESVPGYEAGVTPVNFVGAIEKAKYFDDALNFQGFSSDGYSTSMITYKGTLTYYLNTMINTNMVFNEMEQSEATENMAVYPSDGSIAYIDGIIYVKLSD